MSDQPRSATFKPAAFLTAAAVFRTGVGLAMTLLAVQTLGAESFGRYSVVMAYGSAFLFSYSGVFPVITTRLVGTRGLPDHDRRASQAALFAAALLLAMAGALLLAAAGGLGIVIVGIGRGLARVITACTAIVVSQLISVLCGALLEGLGRLRSAATFTLSGLTLLTGILAVFAVLHRGVDLENFLWISVAAYATEALLAALVVAVVTRELWSAVHESRAQTIESIRRLLREGFNLQAANIVALTMEPVNKSILSAFVGPASIAIYDLANKAAIGLQNVFGAYSRLFLQIDREAVTERLDSLRRAADYSWALFLYAAAFIGAVLMVPAAHWLHLDAVDLGAGFMLFALLRWLIVIATPPYVSLIGFGEYSFVLRNQTILAVANAVAAAVLVPSIGLLGAFLGALLATLLNVVLIERRFARWIPTYESAWSVAGSMAWRLGFGLALLIVPALALPRVLDVHWAWAATAAVAVAIAALAYREPLVPVLLRMARPSGVAGS